MKMPPAAEEEEEEATGSWATCPVRADGGGGVRFMLTLLPPLNASTDGTAATASSSRKLSRTGVRV
jgi:hypothetical protein